MALKPIKGVMAIPPSEADLAGKLSGNKELAGDQLDAFRDAGWHFIATADFEPPSGEAGSVQFREIDTTAADAGMQPEAGQKEAHPRRVYQDGAGHVVIEGAAIVAKFEPSTNSAQVQELLDSYDLEVKRNLGFVPNGFQVVPKYPGVDLLDIATRLENESGVEYAEPATIEIMQNRSEVGTE